MRLDDEEKFSYESYKNIEFTIEENIKKSKIVIISDYSKGVIDDHICKKIIELSNQYKKIVLVDPKKSDIDVYNGCYLIKPNLKEFNEIINENLQVTDDNFIENMKHYTSLLRSKHNISNIAVTLGQYGVFLSNSTTEKIIPTKCVKVCDVSGAGDTMIAAIAVALQKGKTIEDAIIYGNKASSVAITKPGTSVVYDYEIDIHNKELTDSTINYIKNSNKVIGFTNGCFDCCHLGHINSLRQAKNNCDILVVGINSDTWIKNHKGRNRPIQDIQTRTELLKAFEFVDYIIVFDDETPIEIIKKIKPDIIMK